MLARHCLIIALAQSAKQREITFDDRRAVLARLLGLTHRDMPGLSIIRITEAR